MVNQRIDKMGRIGELKNYTPPPPKKKHKIIYLPSRSLKGRKGGRIVQLGES